MKVLVASSSVLSIPLITELKENNVHQILGLITNPDKPTGRGQKIEANDLAAWAISQGLNIYKPESNDQTESLLDRIQPEIVITLAYGRLIKSVALRKPKFGWLNVHFSLLPKWRGAAPVQHALINGEKTTGISIFKLDEGMDTGPVYLANEFPIENDDDTQRLLDRLSKAAVPMIIKVLSLISEGIEPTPQIGKGSSLAPKFNKNDGRINWKSPSISIYNQYRALASNPGVWTNMGNDRLKIELIRETSFAGLLYPGEVSVIGEKIVIGAKPGAIEILQLTPAGRSTMSAAEFVRGLTKKDGLKLG